MIKFERFTLPNGLKVIFYKDETTPMAIVNTLYDVGAKDEDPNRTGFAHLFEHLMFGGSKNIPDFDEPLQRAGGHSNAFTSNDITNYYNVLPAQNIETALWLESDRMLSLAFTPKSLAVQKNVVIEEFKQRYLNQPYGDVWLAFRPLAYEKHPYKWGTIGKNIEQIETATMEEVKAFFFKHYAPQNAILSIVGNFEFDYIKDVVNKWYGDIPEREKYVRNIPEEPTQKKYKTKQIERKVPNNAFYYGFKMPGKYKPGYFAADIISDLLGRGNSSLLFKRLKKEKELVSEINAYVLGSHETGLLMISGYLNDTISFESLDTAFWNIIDEFKNQSVTNIELQKMVNKVRTTKVFSEITALHKAMLLSSHELLGDADFINHEQKAYDLLTPNKAQKAAQKILSRENCSRLTIKAIK